MRSPLCLLLLAAAAQAFQPALPTGNDALLRGAPEQFYMYTDREFEGRKSRPWQGGTYGFSRNPQRVGGKILRTKFHEGIDVSPLQRDSFGEPLDEVRAVADGRVVHVNREARDSNYGIYVVVRHEVDGAPVYSIYAHLSQAAVETGEKVSTGTRLGRLGYTGSGLDQRRAHLHLEIALLWHDKFESWHAANFSSPNKHGIYNGINMMGLDVAALYLAQHENPSLGLREFIGRQKPFFRLQIPESPHFQLPRRYPWLVREPSGDTRSWIVSFSAAGFPLSIERCADSVPSPRVIWAAPSSYDYDKVTRSLLAGRTGQPRLGKSGEKLVSLLTWDPESLPSAGS